MRKKFVWIGMILAAGTASLFVQGVPTATAAPVPGGSLDPMIIPKYVTPLVIPPEMPKSTTQPGTPAAEYNIAVRQFKQQILPGGIWNTLNGRSDVFGATTVWSYGRAQDPLPDSSSIPGGAVGVAPAMNSSFNYPALTIEATSNVPTTVRWINGLVDSTGKYLPHLLPIDQTLHWANPGKSQCMDGTFRTDCRTFNPAPYEGPVPMVVHVHGAHVNPESDGYASAWWLPNASNIPAGYGKRGVDYDQYNIANLVPGSAFYGYENDQPATTIWYHDHTLGMTRSNVYAGPAGFWLIRGGQFGDDAVMDSSNPGSVAQLPSPAPLGTADPNFNAATRNEIREIPLAIQDRSFNYNPITHETSLFYPSTREFFDGFMGPYVPGSDISPIWNPEAFFNTMVVNGNTWPQLDVARAMYRFRLLNGCNSRTINLSLRVVEGPGTDNVMNTADDVLGAEIPFYQIGAEQGFLPKVVKITTGFATQLPGDGTIPDPMPMNPDKAMLLGNAERADVIVDFSSLPINTIVRMINTAPDGPFGGFPDTPADPDTSGQVMQFVVNREPLPSDANTTRPENLILHSEPAVSTTTKIRKLSLNEEESSRVCVNPDTMETIFVDPTFMPDFLARCQDALGVPAAPKEALLGMVMDMNGMPESMPMMWADLISERPILNDTEEWEVYNMTMDAHPIHLHLVGYQVINRQMLMMDAFGNPLPEADPNMPLEPPELNELGYKDTALMYPGMVTRIRAKFDRVGNYVWHCHIVEHEDNEMMRPYTVRYNPDCPDFNNSNDVTTADLSLLMAEMRSARKAKKLAYDLNGDGKLDLLDARMVSAKLGMTCPAPTP